MESAYFPNTMMSQEDFTNTRAIVDRFNKEISEGKIYKNEMDKDTFLRLLITQLANQDPMQPMEDKEFIAQMTQFSTLEQITNMASGLQNLSNLISGNNALSLLGKIVEINTEQGIVKGKVEKVSGGDTQQIFVGGQYYDYQAVIEISTDTLKEVSTDTFTEETSTEETSTETSEEEISIEQGA